MKRTVGRPKKTGTVTTKVAGKTTKNVTAGNLTAFLWTTMQDVKNGSLDPTAAKAITSSANTIVSTAKLNLAYMKYTGKKNDTVSGFLN